MISNLIASTIRNLFKNKILLIVSTVGLGFSFISLIFIVTFIYEKYNSEFFIENSKQIHTITTTVQINNHPSYTVKYSAPELSQYISLRLPEFKTTRRYVEYGAVIENNLISDEEIISWVDSNFFELFDFPTLLGSAVSALRDPDSLIVTRSTAVKYFGSTNVLGKELLVKNKSNLTIRAVIEDIPLGSSFRGGIFASALNQHSSLRTVEKSRKGSRPDLTQTTTNYTYITLPNNSSNISLENSINSLDEVRPLYPDFMTLVLNVDALNSQQINGAAAKKSAFELVIGLAVIGVLIFAISLVNFIILFTARTNTRFVEIGVRLIEGATKSNLIIQFTIESVIYVFIALIFGLGISELLFPYLSTLLDTNLSLFTHPELILYIIIFTLVFSILTSLYPAFLLSSAKPVNTLKGELSKTANGSKIQRILIGFQYCLVAMTITIALFIDAQLDFSLNDIFKFNSQQTFVVNGDCRNTFRVEINKINGIEKLSCSSAAPVSQFSFDSVIHNSKNENKISISGIFVDLNFFDFYKVSPISGRVFSESFKSDYLSKLSDGSVNKANIVINESALKRLGFDNHDSALNHVFHNTILNIKKARVIGIVPDFLIGPVTENIRPLIFIADEEEFNRVTFTVEPTGEKQTLNRVGALWNNIYPDKKFQPQRVSDIYQKIYRNLLIGKLAFQWMSIAMYIISFFGLVGLIMFSLRSKSNEIGVRLSMGADKVSICNLMSFHFCIPLILGSLFSIPTSYYAVSAWLKSIPNSVHINPEYFALSAMPIILIFLIVYVISWKAASQKVTNLLRT